LCLIKFFPFFPPVNNNHLVKITGFCCIRSYNVLCYYGFLLLIVFECYLESVDVAWRCDNVHLMFVPLNLVMSFILLFYNLSETFFWSSLNRLRLIMSGVFPVWEWVLWIMMVASFHTNNLNTSATWSSSYEGAM